MFLVLLIQIDSQLYWSQVDSNYGGYFGFPNWFYNIARLRNPNNLAYMFQWQTFNAARNICGLMSFILGQFSAIPVKRRIANPLPNDGKKIVPV